MAQSFVETMRGALTDDAGRAHPVAFEVRAAQSKAGHFQLSGVVTAPPWLAEGEVTGTLTMAPGLRAIHYEVRFVAADGRTLVLEATKHPSAWSPFASMRHMPVVLRDAAGRPVAQGEMHFALADLPGFVASWLPFFDKAKRALDVRRRAVARRALDGEAPVAAITATSAPARSEPGPEPITPRRILEALAEVAIPAGAKLPAAGAVAIDRLLALLDTLPSAVGGGYLRLLRALDLATLPFEGRRFTALDAARRGAALTTLDKREATRTALRLVLIPLKLAYLDDPAVHAAIGVRYRVESPRQPEAARWRGQVVAAATLADGERLECDVVVVGTGAGGAPVAKALAERGHAVLLVEEGELFERDAYNGRAFEMMRRLYRDGGSTHALGNAFIPIPLGKGVGGTTLINSGTCLRAPDATLREWVAATGIAELGVDHVAPYYDGVERFLGVGPSSDAALGPTRRLIARGCDALGYAHHALPRNAPGCDGQGLCCFGCPTDAKRSTNLSYVPAALERGAQLVTGLAIDKIVVEGETAVGVSGTARGERGPVRVEVRAQVVVLACGSLHTPTLLLRNGLANASGEVGRNLSIHPACGVMGVFDEPVRNFASVPQGYGIHEFQDEGLMFEGGHAGLDITAAMLHEHGGDWVRLVEDAEHWLGFGVMVKDTSRGRVSVGRDGRPRVRYWLNGKDSARLQRGLGILGRVFLAAGAREMRTLVPGVGPVRTLADVEALERRSIAARELDLTAYHPLGTCRIGTDPLRSVVGPSHEAHDVHNLFITDGSAVPGAIGANPMLTIMAFSLRAAEAIDRRLQRLSARHAA